MAIRGIHHEDPFRALNPPLYQTSTFTFPDMESVDRVLGGQESGYVYSRSGNPTLSRFEGVLSLLEGGEDSRAFASGMGAISATLIHLAKGGREVFLPRYIYSGTRAFIHRFLIPWGVPVRWFDSREPDWLDTLAARMSRGSGCVFVESPSNPTMDILDLEALSKTCRSVGVPLVVDNTFASPALQNPLSTGADLVIHSATKYLGGHGDLLGGVVTGAANRIKALSMEEGSFLGATLSPFNAWLLLRGIKTLFLRMNAHSDNAMALANFLSDHPKVKAVHYPGLSSHPGHDVARRQMKRFGGMLSFEVQSAEVARLMCDRLKLVRIGVSLGDPESLIEHPFSMSHRMLDPKERGDAGITPGLLRMSVGLEGVQDLIRDLDRALSG
ncbi:MAG: trans-sulfuration enzyme family protein [Leptospirales bacterium]